MSIQYNAIPLLEFDDESTAVLQPDHEKLGLHLPEKCVFAFLGDHIDRYAERMRARVVSHFISTTKHYPIYILPSNGEEIVLCQAPAGASAAVQLMDWLIGYGVKKIISAGSCGTLEPFDENTFLIPYKALRDEGTSYHYAPPSRFMDVAPTACNALEKAVCTRGLSAQQVVTWSTDGFYRETKAKVAYRKSEGCSVVEMECAALAACAQMRNVTWGMLLYTADTLANPERYDERGWGADACACALEICLDAVHLL